MTRISQLIAVVGGVTAEVDIKVGELRVLAANESLLSGLEQTYEPRNEDGVRLPSKSQKVRLTEETVLEAVQIVLTRKWDTGLTLDTANSNAYASVYVGGERLLEDVPVGHLLYLERELTTLHAVVSVMPTLDQTKDWTNNGLEPGLHKSAPVETASTEKQPYNWHRGNGAPGIKEDVDILTRDEVVGYWTKVTFSGALHPRRKATLLDRISDLRNAVKMAREEANAAQVEDKREGKTIFEWLLRE
jgi:hypothetical protein